MPYPGVATNLAPGGGVFTGTDGTTLQTFNASYVKQPGTNSDLVIASNLLKVSASTYTEYGIHVGIGGTDLVMSITLSAKSSGNRVNATWINFYMGSSPGTTSGDRDGYSIEIDPSNTTSDLIFIQKVTDGSAVGTPIQSTATTFSAGDDICLYGYVSGPNRIIELYCKTGGIVGSTPFITITDDGTISGVGRQEVTYG